MTYVLEFTIHDLPKTTNQNYVGHWTRRHREAKKWQWLVARHIIGSLPSEPLKRAKVFLTRVSAMEPDFDGLSGSFKHVIDALVKFRVLENDKMSNIGIPEYRWQKGERKKGHIIVRVEEVNGPKI